MKIIKSTLLFVILGAISYAAFMAFKLFENKPVGSDADAYYIHIPSSSNLDDVFQIINVHPELKILQKTELSAQILGYTDARVKSGRYKLPQTISSWKLIKLLKSGEQTPLNVVLNNERTLPEVAEKVARYLEPDSMAFINYFESPELVDELQIVPERILCIIIPNTYQFFWNTSPDEFLKRMKKEHDKFWAKEERKAKAAALGLSTDEVYILASIVEKESQIKSERPDIAGLYLNRLQENMKLQADPTVVFAIGDFTLTRVLFNHLMFDSPYNTYMYEGLPPGPICMASINSIDAVLNARKHDYLYMCAKPDLSGGHMFASTYQEHLKNASIYRSWLDNYLRKKKNGE